VKRKATEQCARSAMLLSSVKVSQQAAFRVRSFVSGEMQQIKKQGHRFRLTFDEWTSNRNRRYMCVNVHANTQFWSLGMIRVHGSMPAEKCVELLEQKLSDFGLKSFREYRLHLHRWR